MKRLGMLLMACAIVLGMSQCKKAETPSSNNNEKIHITFSANYNQGNTKTNFDPASNPMFTWTNDVTEYVYVGGDVSGYLGFLYGTGNGMSTMTFSGDITSPVGNSKLYFFYLGNGDHSDPSSDPTYPTLIDFSTQTGNLSVVTNKHIAIGSEVYTGQTDFTATLYMAMSIAYFDTSGFGGETVSISGSTGSTVYSAASINYKSGTISGGATNPITIGTGNSDCYVALIPSAAATSISFSSSSHNGTINFINGIEAGKYYTANGAALVVNP